jgi:hypothetical protein
MVFIILGISFYDYRYGDLWGRNLSATRYINYFIVNSDEIRDSI